MALLEVKALRKRYGGLDATAGVDLAVEEHQIHAVIGPNGAGKTTLIAQLSGEIKSDGGRVLFHQRDITHWPSHKRARMGLARSFQITSVFADMSLLENTALAVQAQAGHSYRFWRRALDDSQLLEPARAALEQVGLGKRADRLASEVSHGEHRQLEIAMALATGPELLLLDEPMAGMGPEEATRMVEILRDLKGRKTMLLVEHDMDAVFALADCISVLVYGKVIATGPPATIRADQAVRHAYLGDEAS